MADRVEEFVNWLVGRVGEDRAVRAALRRGLGQPLGYAPEMLMYMAPQVQGMSEWQERTAYIVASLFALHPMSAKSGNLGDHLAGLRGKNDEALERRVGVLLAAHEEELDVYLRQAVSMLKQKDIPVNWLQLFKDIMAWRHPDGQARVRRAWANSFYRYATPAETDEDSLDTLDEEEKE